MITVANNNNNNNTMKNNVYSVSSQWAFFGDHVSNAEKMC